MEFGYTAFKIIGMKEMKRANLYMCLNVLEFVLLNRLQPKVEIDITTLIIGKKKLDSEDKNELE